ncbi:roundabout homolog 1 [Nematolebias whitei]|uniref:roundabout homolog 1 n=1 Tax=Nematolebias whitei TaxID=451745 RepID=UPI00189AD8AA|nr:roundabout homolog 1 [Nematolebias whitei]
MPPHIVHHPSDVVVKVGNPATLSCRVDGKPKPTIEWLHNGQPLETGKGDRHLQPIVLSEGSLFFLNVGSGKRGPSHEGFYVCIARNSAGIAISRNASLYIAVLQDEFVVEPNDVEVAEGEVAVLNCAPPYGHPEPNVIWKKNGLPINNTDHHYTELGGKLIIAPAEKNHSGSYICVAQNSVGVQESRAARLSVLAKPVLVLKPENVSVRIGESTQFYCQAKGEPPPAVEWSREQGPLPNGRYLINPEQTLQLHYVKVEDAGKYICTAVNHVGVVSAAAQLLVEEAASEEQKDFHKELSALRVVLENVSIMTTGSNISLIQWKLQSFPNQPHYLTGFEVLYRSLLPIISDWTAKKVALPRFQAQVGPLKRGYRYEFKVRPYGSNLYGRESNTQLLRVPEKVPGAPPQAVFVTVNYKQKNSICLSWEPPPHESHNGVIQGYQVWCVEAGQKQYQNWTVGSGQHSLNISTVKAGQQYWVTMAAVNGAGVGTLSDPHGFIINPPFETHPETEKNVSGVLDLLQDPVLIGSMGAVLWCVLMVAAVCLFRRHSSMDPLLARHGKAKGLHRLANENVIIKHRMASADLPWLSGSWRPPFNKKYQDLWAQGHNHSEIRSTSLPVSSKDTSATDGCGVYGTFYVDLMGNGMKTFNSPGHSAKLSQDFLHQQGTETIQIFTQPASKSSSCSSRESLPWKQAIRPQPKMGLLRESWEKKTNDKQELQAVNSVPLLSRSQACPFRVCRQRLSHIPTGHHGRHPYNCGDAAAGSRLLHYSASLHMVNMLPPSVLIPSDESADRNNLSIDDGSNRSTNIEDMIHLQSNCPGSSHRGPPGSNKNSFPFHVHLSTPSYPASLDGEHGGTLTSQEATEYLELSPKHERSNSILSEQQPSVSLPCTSTLENMCGLIHSSQQEDNPTPEPVGQRLSRLQSSPSSCYSDFDHSLWSTWSSAMTLDFDSNRTSLISSVNSCYTQDSASFARMLAVAADTLSGDVSDFSPPASPFSTLYPSFCADSEVFEELEHVPTWDWSMAWMEEMDAQYRALYPSRNT